MAAVAAIAPATSWPSEPIVNTPARTAGATPSDDRERSPLDQPFRDRIAIAERALDHARERRAGIDPGEREKARAREGHQGEPRKDARQLAAKTHQNHW